MNAENIKFNSFFACSLFLLLHDCGSIAFSNIVYLETLPEKTFHRTHEIILKLNFAQEMVAGNWKDINCLIN